MSQHRSAVRSRTALVEAATRLLDAREPAGISITQVVEAAGVSRPTFYQHFSDLGQLFASAGVHRLEALMGQVPPASEGEAPGADIGAVVRLMEPHATFFHHVTVGPGAAEFQARAVAMVVARLRGEPGLGEVLGDDPAAWEFVGAGTVWTVTRHLAAVCADPATAGEPGRDLQRILTALVAETP